MKSAFQMKNYAKEILFFYYMLIIDFFYCIVIVYNVIDFIVWFLYNKPKLIFRNKHFANTPCIDVVIPVYKECYSVIEKTIEHACKLNYPNYNVFMLDEINTTERINLCERYNVKHIHRLVKGYAKAGNLNYFLTLTSQSKSEFVLIIDADHLVEPDALNYILSHMEDDTGFVCALQEYYNNPIYISSSGNFHINTVSLDIGALYGTNMLIRRSALNAVGNFPVYSVGEDHALTHSLLFANIKGKTIYNNNMFIGTTPQTLYEYRCQLHRWFLGDMQRCIVQNCIFSSININEKFALCFYQIRFLNSFLVVYTLLFATLLNHDIHLKMLLSHLFILFTYCITHKSILDAINNLCIGYIMGIDTLIIIAEILLSFSKKFISSAEVTGNHFFKDNLWLWICNIFNILYLLLSINYDAKYWYCMFFTIVINYPLITDMFIYKEKNYEITPKLYHIILFISKLLFTISFCLPVSFIHPLYQLIVFLNYMDFVILPLKSIRNIKFHHISFNCLYFIVKYLNLITDNSLKITQTLFFLEILGVVVPFCDIIAVNDRIKQMAVFYTIICLRIPCFIYLYYELYNYIITISSKAMFVWACITVFAYNDIKFLNYYNNVIIKRKC